MNYYKTGEFANLANVTIRTIRYYDKKGILKPSKIDTNGYRLYTDEDLVKLQQVLSLKYLGFSLDEILTMTRNSNQQSLKQSLALQERLINQRINQLKLVQSAIKDTNELLEENKEVNWQQILKLIHLSTMADNIIEQYKNSTNVETRIRLHEKYSTNPIHWFKWLFNQYEFSKDCHILEIGAGNGQLWSMNKSNIPDDSHIILNDISEGMLEDAKKNLKDIKQISYECYDAQTLPYKENSMDVVIANHVMFYLKDINKALQEIKRVLKPEGTLYVSTYGHYHMKEITDLVKSFNPLINLSPVNLYEIFGLENGKEILTPYFNHIDKLLYKDSLEVTDKDELANYILSCHGNQLEYIAKDFDRFDIIIKQHMNENNAFHVTKEAGLFVCKNNEYIQGV